MTAGSLKTPVITCAKSSWVCMHILSDAVASGTRNVTLRECVCGLLCVISKRGSV